MTDRLSYLELKKDLVFQGETLKTRGLDLPIETSTLIGHIEHGENGEIPWSDFVRGMLLHLAMHGHDASYEKFLADTVKNPAMLALHYADEESDDLFIEAARILSDDPMVSVAHAQNLLRKASKGDDKALKQAMKELDRVLDQTPFAPAYALYGELFLALGDELKAHQYFKHALSSGEHAEFQEKMRERVEETATGAAVTLAVDAMNKGRTEEAYKILTDRLKDDDAGVLHYWQGVVLQGLGRLEESVDAFQCAKDKRPEDLRIPNDLAISLYMLGDREEAVEVLKKAMSSGDPRILCNLMILSEPDDQRFADEIYQKLQQLEAEDVIEDASISKAVKEYGIRFAKRGASD